MTRLSKALWADIVNLVETLEAADMSAEDAQQLTADNPLLIQLVASLKQERLEHAQLERTELSPPVVAAPGFPVTFEQAFFPKGKSAYRPYDKNVRARVLNTLAREIMRKLRSDDAMYITDLRHLSRSDVSDMRNMGEASMVCLEQIMAEQNVVFADPLDPEMIAIGTKPRLYYSRSEILDVEIRRIVSSLGVYIDFDDVSRPTPTLGQYLRMEVTARNDFCDEPAQHQLDEFVEQHGIAV